MHMTTTTRDEYVARLKKQLDAWNVEIDRWEKRMNSQRRELDARYRVQIERVRSKRESALYNLRLLEGASASAWMDLRSGMDDAWDRLREAVQEARAHFERAT